MAVFQDFSVETNKTYVLRTAQGTTSGSTLRKPDAGQFIAGTWDGTKLTPVYFTSFDEKGSTADPTTQLGTTVVGERKGAELFIIHHPTLGLRPDLETELRDWVDLKHAMDTGNRDTLSKKKRTRSIAVGQFLKGQVGSVEKILGEWPKKPKAVTPPAAVQDMPPQAAPEATIRDAAAEVSREPTTLPVARPSQRVERDPRSLPPIPDSAGDDDDDLPREVRNFDGLVFRGTVARINNEEAQFRHIHPDNVIPELNEGGRDKDAFAHFNQVPEAEQFREGDRVEFELQIAPNGRIQVKNAWRVGEARPDFDTRDQGRANDSGHGTDSVQDPNEPAEFDSRGRRIIRDPIPTPFRTELPNGGVIPGGAWKPVRARDRDPA